MAKLFVQFVSDSSVSWVTGIPSKDSYIEHCGLGVGGYKQRLKSAQSKEGSFSYLQPIDENNLLEDTDIFFKPTTLVQIGETEKAFGFRSPSKNVSILQRLESSADKTIRQSSSRSPKCSKIPLSPLARPPVSPRTPPNKRTPRNVKSIYQTPTSSRIQSSKRISCSAKKKSTPSTPYSFRNRVKKRISRIILEDVNDISDIDISDSTSDEDESSFETDGTDEDDSDFQSHSISKSIPSKLSRTPLRTPRRAREHKVNVDMTASADDYFDHNSENAPSITSDRTLNQLKNPRLGPDALKALLEGSVMSHERERQELFDDHVTLFSHWMTMLSEGFSVFLCGVGSKKKLLSLFQLDCLVSFDHVVVNGFFPSLTIRTVLSTIIEEVICQSYHPINLNDQMALIESHYHKSSLVDPLFLVVHNLDGPMLRNEKAQDVLSRLASFRHIHFIVSVDHINAALLFDSNKYSLYNPLWWDATTLAPYREETSYENSLMVQQSGTLVLSSLLHVFRSLTPNAKGIFLIVVKHQLCEKNDSNYQGLSFNELYQKCRESFLVNSDLTLRAQLTEFKDHKLIRTKKSLDSVERLVIPLNVSTLEEFLDQEEINNL